MNNHWINESIFYHIYPLGLCDALYKNNYTDSPKNKLDRLYEWLDHIKDLGCNAIYLGPLFESSYHGYDTVDYYNVDRRLGTNEALKTFIQECHSMYVKVILDGVFNHCGRDFFAFRDVLQNKQKSKFLDWFFKIDFGGNSPYNDGFRYEGWDGNYDLVKFNLKNDEVKKYLFDAVEMWIDYFQIDGLRLDAADCIDFEFLKALRNITTNKKNFFWLMGEVVHGDYTKWANPHILHSTTNYECYKGLYSCHNDANYFEIAYSLNRLFGENGLYKNINLYNFADNHDVTRVSSIVKNKSHLYPLYLLLFTMNGIPSIYYGSEFGLEGERTRMSDKPLRPSLQLRDAVQYSKHPDLLKFIKKMIRIRKKYKSLKYGDYKQIFVTNNQFGFKRSYRNETIYVILNLSGEPAKIKLNNIEKNNFKDLLNDYEEIAVNSELFVYPNWGKILI